MSVEEVVRRRGIEEVLHFTTNRGLLGVLYDGRLLSRARLPSAKHLEHVYRPNAAVRHDPDWLDYVNLSVSRINRRFFDSSNRWHRNEEVWWCILSFGPEILGHPGVHFSTTNNFYTGAVQAPDATGLEAVFGERIRQWEGHYVTRPDGLAAPYPTCRQAEALYPEAVSTDFLHRVYVVNDLQHDIALEQTQIVDHPPVSIEVRSDAFD